MMKILVLMALVVVFAMPTAYAEMLVIEGNNDVMGIFIVIEDDSNMIIIDTDLGFSEHLDSNLKKYHTGAFSLKNVEDKVAVWVHPFSDTQYRIVVLTDDGVQRIIGNVVTKDNLN